MKDTQKNLSNDPWLMREFVSPLCLMSIALFALNNFYLKYAFHNTLTGKLSDLTLCFFLPLFLSALIGLIPHHGLKTSHRLMFGSILTVLLFSTLKLSLLASNQLNALLSIITLKVGIGPSINRIDPSDLVALPCTVLAFFYGLNCLKPITLRSSS